MAGVSRYETKQAFLERLGERIATMDSVPGGRFTLEADLEDAMRIVYLARLSLLEDVERFPLRGASSIVELAFHTLDRCEEKLLNFLVLSNCDGFGLLLQEVLNDSTLAIFGVLIVRMINQSARDACSSMKRNQLFQDFHIRALLEKIATDENFKFSEVAVDVCFDVLQELPRNLTSLNSLSTLL